ncbi:hypothetical protein [Saccharothrix stipae]
MATPEPVSPAPDTALPLLAELLAELDTAHRERDKLCREVDRLTAAGASPAPDTEAPPLDLHERLLALVPYMSRRVPPASTENLLDQVASDIGQERRVRELLLGALAIVVEPLGITREQVESSPHGEAIRAREQVAGLRADLHRARDERDARQRVLDEIREHLDLPDTADLAMVESTARAAIQTAHDLTAELARVSGARPIPDDAAAVDRLAVWLLRAMGGNIVDGPGDAAAWQDAFENGLTDNQRATWRAAARALLADLGATPTTGPAPAAADPTAPYRHLLGAIWLYVDWRYLTKQMTTEQKELWADAVDAFGEPQEGKAERWWREPAAPQAPAEPTDDPLVPAPGFGVTNRDYIHESDVADYEAEERRLAGEAAARVDTAPPDALADFDAQIRWVDGPDDDYGDDLGGWASRTREA